MLKKSFKYKSLLIFIGASLSLVACEASDRLYNDEAPPTKAQEEAFRARQERLAAGEYIFNNKEISRFDYEQILARKIDLEKSNRYFSKIDQVNAKMQRNRISRVADIDAVLKHQKLGFLSSEKRTVKENSVIFGDKEVEGRPFAVFDSGKGSYFVNSGKIPRARVVSESEFDENNNRILNARQIKRDAAIRSNLDEMLSRLGVEKDETDVFITSVMSNIIEDGKTVIREHERVVYVNRKIGNVKVDNNRIVASFDLDGNLKRLSGTWNKINYADSQFEPKVPLENVYQGVVDQMRDSTVNPFDTKEIFVEPRFSVEQNDAGEYVLNLKAQAAYHTIAKSGMTSASAIELEL